MHKPLFNNRRISVSPHVDYQNPYLFSEVRHLTNVSLSSSAGEDIESAAGRKDTPTGGVEENELVFEATEDRIILGFSLSINQVDCIAELSFSSRMLTKDTPKIDETGSGVVAVVNSDENLYQTVGGDPGIMWHAGEELNLHVDNLSGNANLTTVVIHYLPVGEFNRNQLRNKA